MMSILARRLASLSLHHRHCLPVRWITSGPILDADIVPPESKTELEDALARHEKLVAINSTTTPSPEVKFSLEKIRYHHYNLGNWSEMLEIEEELREGYYSSTLDMAKSCNRLGIIYQNLEDFEESYRCFHESLHHYQQIHPRSFHVDVGEAWNSLAGLAAYQTEIPQALEWLELGEPHFRYHGQHMEDVDESNEKPHAELQKVLQNKADMLRVMGEHFRALGVYTEIQDLVGKDKADINLQLDMADCMLTLGHKQEAQETYQDVLGKVDEDSEIAANVNYQLGLYYHSCQEPQDARKHLQRALDTKQRFYGDLHLDVGKTQNALGAAHANLDDPKQSLACFRQALMIYRIHTDYDKEDDDPEIQRVLKNISTVEKNMQGFGAGRQ